MAAAYDYENYAIGILEEPEDSAHARYDNNAGAEDPDRKTTSPTTTTTTALSTDVKDASTSEKKISTSVNKIFEHKNITDILRFLNPKAFYKKAYINLDWRYVSHVNEARTKFTWNLINNPDTNMSGANVASTIQNIVEIRAQRSSTPKSIAGFDTTVCMICIDELANQGFIMSDGRRFHFWGNSSSGQIGLDVRDQIHFDEGVNNGIFRFNKPVASLDSMTISIFNTATEYVVFPNDRFVATIDVSNHPYSYTITTSIPHNTWEGFHIFYMDSFTTDQPEADTFNIQFINRVQGHGTANPVDDYTLVYNNNFDTYTASQYPPFVGTPVGTTNIYVANYRSFMGFEVTYIT